MSRMIAATQTIRQTTETLQGSFPWMAIEFFKPQEARFDYTKETDIWAFGMTSYVSSCIVDEYRISDS